MCVWRCRSDWNSDGDADKKYTRSLCCVVAIMCRSLPESLSYYGSPPSQHATRWTVDSDNRYVSHKIVALCVSVSHAVTYRDFRDRTGFNSFSIHFYPCCFPVCVRNRLSLSEFRQDKRCTKNTSNIMLWSSIMSCSCWTAQSCLVAIKLTSNNNSGKSAWKSSDIET